MSYLDRPPLDSDGLEQFIDPQRWNAFVQVVLEITVQAYQNLYIKGIAQSQWKEDLFTVHLKKCIRPLAFIKGILIQLQSPIYTPEIEAGEIPVEQAKRLDLRMHGSWQNYDEICFIWECKWIAPSSEEKYKHLVYDYVTDGVIRFLHEEWKYANYVDDSGMIGYVLAGDVTDIVDDINQKMLVSPRPRKSKKSNAQQARASLSSYTFSVSDNLKSYPPIATFSHIYQSCHDRAFCARKIRLYHLFLTFDFDNRE